MIDTIVITIESGKYKIIGNPRFKSSSGATFNKKVFNATNDLKRRHGYMPRITEINAIRQGGYTKFLKVEFSAPKILFGNNFDELTDNDLENLVDSLCSKLFKIGFVIRKQHIIEAQISAIHFSKNIILKDYTTPLTYMKEIQKCNISKIYDVNQTDFRNEGHAIRYRSSNFEVTFYDKIEDLKQSKKSNKRAIEDDNEDQLKLFNKLQSHKPFEVLRFEIRIGNRKKLIQLLKKYDLDVNTKLKDIFSWKLSQKILSSIFAEIVDRYNPPIEESVGNKYSTLLTQLQIIHPELGYSQLLKYFGARVLVEELGVRKFRKLTASFNDNNWYRLNQQLNDLNLETNEQLLSKLTDTIKAFNQIKLEDYLDKL